MRVELERRRHLCPVQTVWLTRVADNGGEVFEEQGPQKGRHGAGDSEGGYDNAVILRVVHVVVVHRRHHVVGHHLTKKSVDTYGRDRNLVYNFSFITCSERGFSLTKSTLNLISSTGREKSKNTCAIIDIQPVSRNERNMRTVDVTITITTNTNK